MVDKKVTVKYNSSEEKPNISCIEYEGRFYWRIRTTKYIKVLNMFFPISIKFGITPDFKKSV
jgi:hypothetical protein